MFGGGCYPTAFANSGLSGSLFRTIQLYVRRGRVSRPEKTALINGSRNGSPTDTPESVS